MSKVPAQAVEAAAKAAFSLGSEMREWGNVPDVVRARYREEVTLALEAATPYMQASLWSRQVTPALWAEFQAATHEAGTNPSETIRQLIQEWVHTHKQRGTQ